MPEESPAHLVRDIRFSNNAYDYGPEEFFEHIPRFTKAERLSVMGSREYGLSVPPFWKLPQSVTSLTIDAPTITVPQIRSIMARLPGLDDLSLSGGLAMGRGESLGIETALRGRFGGRLRIVGNLIQTDVVDMLLEIPTGLRFTELQIHSMWERLLPTVRLAEACRKTLVKLSYTVDSSSKFHPFPILTPETSILTLLPT